MRRGDANDPVHEREWLVEVIGRDVAAEIRPHPHFVEGDAGDRIPQGRPRLDDLELGVEPPHAVADEDEVLHRRILSLRIEPPHRRGQLATELGGGLEERRPGRVVKQPRLEALEKPGADAEFVEEIEPGSLVAPQAVDEDHRDAAGAMGLEELEPRSRIGAPVRHEEVHDVVVGRHPAEHVEQRRRQVGGEERAGGTEIDRRDLHRIDQIEDRGGVIARQRPREGLEDVLVGRLHEAEHGRRREALAFGREDPVALPIGRRRHADTHRQAEAPPFVAALDPLVAGRRRRLDTLDRRGRDLHPRHLDRHDDRPPLRPDQQPSAVEPPVGRRRFEQALERAGVEFGRRADELGVARAEPHRVPGGFGGGEIAVDRPAVAVCSQLCRLLGVVLRPSEMTAGLVMRRHLGIGHRQGERLREPLQSLQPLSLHKPLCDGVPAGARHGRGHDQHRDLPQPAEQRRILRRLKRPPPLRGRHMLLVSAPAGSAQQEE